MQTFTNLRVAGLNVLTADASMSEKGIPKVIRISLASLLLGSTKHLTALSLKTPFSTRLAIASGGTFLLRPDRRVPDRNSNSL